MKLQAHRICHTIRIAILLGAASAAALANQSPTLVSGSRTPMCYCHCEHGAGAKQCMKMCELPQYEKRWWATSCHKKSSFSKELASHDSNSNSHSRKTNRTEEARR
jgi:hypothetical protein